MEKPRNKRKLLLPVAVFVLVWLGMDYFFSNNVLSLQRIEFESVRLPAEFDGLKVIHLSDLHQKSFGENNHKLLLMIEGSKPDMIAITGDLIDSIKDLDYARALAGELLKLAPVYYVTGNHEWGGGVARMLKKELAEMGVVVLSNAFAPLAVAGRSICIAGLDDPNGPRDMKTLPEVMDEIHRDMGDPFVLMLSHRNDRFDEYAEAGVDLVLSGHAHGGLVRLPFTDGLIGPGRVLFPKYTSGLYTKGDTAMIASRGIGGTIVDLRLFNRPHVLEIVLKSTMDLTS